MGRGRALPIPISTVARQYILAPRTYPACGWCPSDICCADPPENFHHRLVAVRISPRLLRCSRYSCLQTPEQSQTAKFKVGSQPKRGMSSSVRRRYLNTWAHDSACVLPRVASPGERWASESQLRCESRIRRFVWSSQVSLPRTLARQTLRQDHLHQLQDWNPIRCLCSCVIYCRRPRGILGTRNATTIHANKHLLRSLSEASSFF